MNTRIASGLCVLALAIGCKDKPSAKPAAGSAAPAAGSAAPVVPAARPTPALRPATEAERAMVTTWFRKLNGKEELVITGVDVGPFRGRHAGYDVNDGTSIVVVAVPEGRRTFEVSKFVVPGEAAKVSVGERVFMTFNAKDELVGISY